MIDNRENSFVAICRVFVKNYFWIELFDRKWNIVDGDNVLYRHAGTGKKYFIGFGFARLISFIESSSQNLVANDYQHLRTAIQDVSSANNVSLKIE